MSFLTYIICLPVNTSIVTESGSINLYLLFFFYLIITSWFSKKIMLICNYYFLSILKISGTESNLILIFFLIFESNV